MNRRLSVLILLLILSLIAVLAASGAASAAGATRTTYTWWQIPLAIVDPGTTWTAGGIVELRGQVVDTLCFWDYDGDGGTDQMTIVELTSFNYSRNAVSGAGVCWGTWSEYDYDSGTVLVDGATYEGKYTCWEGLDEPEPYVNGWVSVLAWRLGPDGRWGQIKGRLTLYSLPWGSDYPFLWLGEASFLAPPGM